MKKVFIYVGHSNWGKSMALKALTGGNSHQRTVSILGNNIRVRKMSNDDDGQGLFNWVKNFPILYYQRFIIAFCPKASPIDGEATLAQNKALDILIELQKTNQLYFFIQKEKYKNPTLQISLNEINWLRNFGNIEILEGQFCANERANMFELFIQKFI